MPTEVIKMNAEEIIEIWKAEARSLGIKRANKLLKYAKNSVGIKHGSRAVNYEIKLLIDEYTNINKQTAMPEFSI